jgi:hypothetical protein
MDRFARLAPCVGPPLDELLLTLAAEFQPVDRPAATRALDELSLGLASTPPLAPREQASITGDWLGYVAGLRPARSPTPDALLLDSALRERAGTPPTLAAIYAIAAQRAGVPLLVASAGSRWLVTHAGAPTVVVDPAQSGALLESEEIPAGLRVLSPHEIAFEILSELIGAYALTRNLRDATKAAELRLLLPIHGAPRERAAAEIRGLKTSLK